MIRLSATALALAVALSSAPAGAGAPDGGDAAAQGPAMVSIPVLSHPVDAGETISEADLMWLDLPAQGLPRHIAADPAQVAGEAARKPLNAGMPISLTDLRKPLLVDKGSVVLLRVAAEGIELSATGKALDQGAMGESVRVLNPSSNRIVSAMVTGPGTASVPFAQ